MTAPICVSRLAHTDQSIANIARQCGYVNQGRFARVFYEKYHVKPLDYRRQTRLQTNET
ncbi:helix-turn-helix domain-containing protein [Gemmiger sp.]